jgi:DNA-binding transcriptional ArsR family regulator
MKSLVQTRFEARARVLKALAHPTRLFIVDQLSRGEHCVCELTEMIGADTSTVSKHLSVLKSADILRDEKRGAQVYYHLKTSCILGLIENVDSVLRCAAVERSQFVQAVS